MYLIKGHYDRGKDVYTGILYDNTKQAYIPFTKKNPESPAYIALNPPNYIREYIRASEAREIRVPYKNREYHLADRLGMNNFKEDVEQKKYIKEMVYLNPSLYGADFNICDLVLKDKLIEYEKDTDTYDNIHQAFLDIETDVLMAPGDNDNQAIYMFATYFDKDNTVYLDWLGDERSRANYNNQEELRDPDKWVEKIKANFIKEVMNTPKMNEKKFIRVRDEFIKIIQSATYHIVEWTDEKTMIREAWQRVMRKKKPAYLQIYNADYDVSQSYRRYIKLGGDPVDLFTDPRIGDYYNLHCKTIRQIKGTYTPPRKKKFHPLNEPQWYETSTCTGILDTQVIHYGPRVKEENSYSLEATTQRELGFGKLDYTKTAQSIFHLPYADFALTAEYNIRDTMLLKALEIATDNMLANMIKRSITATEWDRLYVSKAYCTNAFNFRANKRGIIQRNEINSYLTKMPRSFYESLPNKLLLNLFDGINKEEDMAGGFVANPNKLRAIGPEFVRGVTNNKRQTLSIDIDAEAHYPSAIITNNIGLESLWNEIKYIEYESIDGNINRIEDPSFITMKLINRDIVGIGELFCLPTLEKITEIHYGIDVDWNKFHQESKPKRYTFNTTYTKMKTPCKNIFNDKINSIDENAEMFSMSNHFALTLGKPAMQSYYGTYVKYHFEDKDGKPVNTLAEFIKDFDYQKTEVFGKIVKDKDTQIEYFEEVIDPMFLKYISLKNDFDESKTELLYSEYVSEEELTKISKSRDAVYRYHLDKYHVDVTNRIFANPNPKAEVKASLLKDKEYGDILFKFDSRLNIKIDKNTEISLVLTQVFNVLV